MNLEVAPADRRQGIRQALIIVAVIVVAVLIAWVTAAALTHNVVPAKASVNGVEIGGLKKGAAIDKLHDEFKTNAARPIQVLDGDQVLGTFLPVAAGLGINYEQTVKAAGAGASWSPRHIFRVWRGGGPTELEIDVDREKLASQVQSIASDVHRAPVSAQVILHPDGKIERQAMQTGQRMLVDNTAGGVRGSYIRQMNSAADHFQVSADLHRENPPIDDETAGRFINETLQPALQPITISTGTQRAVLGPEVLAAGLSVNQSDDRLTLDTDVARIVQAAQGQLAPLNGSEPVDAKVVLKDGRPTVLPSVAGEGFTPAELTEALTSVLVNGKPREINLDVAAQQPKFTTKDAEALQIREVTGEFTTFFPPSEYRNINLGLVAKAINGTLIKPGEIFSLAEVTGPRNASTGYVPGGVLVGDRIEYVVGGGVSQSATTTYNAAFFAGMTDVEHHPHTQYFSQYPPGREATVYEGQLDLKFRNDTPYGVLMEAYVRPSGPGNGSITVRIWSSRYYDSVQASEPVMSNFTNAPARSSNRPDCVPQNAAQGFDVAYKRLLTKDGQTRVEDYFWTYQPIPAITCTA